MIDKQYKNRTNIVLIWTYWTVLEQKISLEMSEISFCRKQP